MKIKIEYTVDVNEEDWYANFGVDKSEMREDVKHRAKYIFIGQCENDGVRVR